MDHFLLLLLHFHVKWKVTFHSSYTGMTNDLDDPILKLPVSLTINIEKKSVDKSSIRQYTFSIRRF